MGRHMVIVFIQSVSDGSSVVIVCIQSVSDGPWVAMSLQTETGKSHNVSTNRNREKS